MPEFRGIRVQTVRMIIAKSFHPLLNFVVLGIYEII
jgi:hypothetical protein